MFSLGVLPTGGLNIIPPVTVEGKLQSIHNHGRTQISCNTLGRSVWILRKPDLQYDCYIIIISRALRNVSSVTIQFSSSSIVCSACGGRKGGELNSVAIIDS